MRWKRRGAANRALRQAIRELNRALVRLQELLPDRLDSSAEVTPSYNYPVPEVVNDVANVTPTAEVETRLKETSTGTPGLGAASDQDDRIPPARDDRTRNKGGKPKS